MHFIVTTLSSVKCQLKLYLWARSTLCSESDNAGKWCLRQDLVILSIFWGLKKKRISGGTLWGDCWGKIYLYTYIHVFLKNSFVFTIWQECWNYCSGPKVPRQSGQISSYFVWSFEEHQRTSSILMCSTKLVEYMVWVLMIEYKGWLWWLTQWTRGDCLSFDCKCDYSRAKGI